jgi:hypothetical protein
MPMHEIETAHLELERLQGVITRHEAHMFSLRGWLLTVVGGLLAAYYTDNIALHETWVRVGLPTVALLFLIVESRHANIVEAVVERAGRVESLIRAAHRSGTVTTAHWYDGPKVNEACEQGANRWVPHHGMTLIMNLPFYLIVILVIVILTVSLPAPKGNRARPGSEHVRGSGDLVAS